MDISKEMLVDILENLSDDELRLFLEHLVNHNSDAKDALYKYYQGLLNEQYIAKKNYKERINEEINIKKIHEFSFTHFYELINNSIKRFLKDSDDFVYELVFEAYIQLKIKHSKIEFLDIFNYLDNLPISLTNNTLEIIIEKIKVIKNNKIELKLQLLSKLLNYVNKDELSIYLDYFYNLYEVNENKDIYLPLIDQIFIYLQKNYSTQKAIHFLEYFIIENYRINHTVVAFYLKEKDYEKAISILNRINASKLKENEYKDYLINKGKIYQKMGSNKLYFKSLIDLVLHNYFEYINILKEEQKERDFEATLSFIVDNLKIKDTANISLLHSILKENSCEQGLINYFNYFDPNLIYEDILYFKNFNLEKASTLYQYFILELTNKIDSNPKLNSLIEHLIELKNYYIIKDFNLYLNKIKKILKPQYYNYLYSYLLREFPNE